MPMPLFSRPATLVASLPVSLEGGGLVWEGLEEEDMVVTIGGGGCWVRRVRRVVCGRESGWVDGITLSGDWALELVALVLVSIWIMVDGKVRREKNELIDTQTTILSHAAVPCECPACSCASLEPLYEVLVSSSSRTWSVESQICGRHRGADLRS